ncbi:phage holin family protein [Streptosporangium sandarakinum]|uniref:phage holin family protein n=1 Tax=Streptosporangium sandarakinum TaxID=1260955 RepID=UPI0033AAEB03
MTDTQKETLSTAELVRRLSQDVSRLVRDELRLAKLELAEKGKHAGLGAGLFGGAGAMALYGGGALVAAAILALALVLPGWLSALIIGVVLLVLAAILGLLGKHQVSEAGPPAPRHTIESVRNDIDTVRERAHR